MGWIARLRSAFVRRIAGPAIRSEIDSAALRQAHERLQELANPILASFLQGTGMQSIGPSLAYEPLDQNFKGYQDATGKFAILSGCDDAVGNAAASVPLELIRVPRGASDEEIVEDHPLLDLLRDPNPEQGFAQFWYAMSQQWGRCGQVFLSGVGRPELAPWAAPEELWVLDSGRMKPIPNRAARRAGKGEAPIARYVYVADDGSETPFATTQIIHIKRPHFTDPVVGLSPTKELEASLNLWWNAQRWLNDYFRRGATPGRIFIKDAPPPTDEQRARFAMQTDAGVDRMRAGGNLYLYGKWSAVEGGGSDPTAARVIDLLKMLEQHIIAVRGVPPFQLGDLEHANWSNSVEQQQMFYQRAVIPFLRSITDALNTHPIVKVWKADGEKLFLRHNYSSIEALQPNKLSQAQRAQIIVREKIGTVNEGRDIVGLPDRPDGDVFVSAPDPSNAIVDRVRQQSAAGRAEFLASLADARRQSLGTGGRSERALTRRWHAAERRKAPFEKGTREVMGLMFAEMKRRVLAAAAEGHVPVTGELAEIDPHWAERLFRPIEFAREWGPRLGAIAEATLKAGAEDLAREAKPEYVAFDISTPEMQAFIDRWTARRVVTVAESRLGEIEAIVRAAVADGRTAEELSTALREHFDRNESFWSNRIARTETLALYNQGGLLGMKDAGVELKEWLAAPPGENRRPRHQDASGQRVPLDDPFIVSGYSVQAPGQFGIAEEDIGCACTVIPGGTEK